MAAPAYLVAVPTAVAGAPAVAPPPIPSPWDEQARRMGVDRETLPAFRAVYPYVYYLNPAEPGLKFTRLRDTSGGRVSLSPELQYHVTHGYDFWLRDARMRDPLEVAWQRFWREVLQRPTLEQLFARSYRPKWISPDAFLRTDGYVPLRCQAPVYCGFAPLGTCIAKYARVEWCRANGSVTAPVPFLAVTPIDATGNGPAVMKEYFGAWWDVPLSMCIPLRLAVLQWPTANSAQPADQVLMMREDGLAELVNINYFEMDTQDPAIVFARLAFQSTYPSAAATTSVPIVPNPPERAAAMRPYSVVRYEPEKAKDDEEEGDGGGDDDGGGGAQVADGGAVAPPSATVVGTARPPPNNKAPLAVPTTVTSTKAALVALPLAALYPG